MLPSIAFVVVILNLMAIVTTVPNIGQLRSLKRSEVNLTIVLDWIEVAAIFTLWKFGDAVIGGGVVAAILCFTKLFSLMRDIHAVDTTHVHTGRLAFMITLRSFLAIVLAGLPGLFA
jgi:hypothetical protein